MKVEERKAIRREMAEKQKNTPIKKPAKSKNEDIVSGTV